MNRVQDMSPSFKVVSTTVRLDGRFENGGTCIGTGFLFDFADEGEPMMLTIVTNRHVLVDLKTGDPVKDMDIVFSVVKDGRRVTRPFTFDDVQQFVSFHPDPEVDLCAIWLHRLVDAFPLLFGEEFCHAVIIPSDIPSAQDVSEMSAIEDVIMVGYPIGLRDEGNNLPLARRGVTATPYIYDYDGKPDFMLDIACFHGSSGSPVYILDEGVYAGKNGLIISQGVARFKFLGVVKENRFEVNPALIAGQIESGLVVTDPINLALCVKSNEVMKIRPAIVDVARNHGWSV